MAFAPYVTIPEFKVSVGLTDTIDDVELGDILDSTSRWIDDYCDRHFWQDVAVARTFEACHWYELDIDDLVSITSLKTDEAGDGTFETTWAASDYQLQPVNRPTGRPFTRVEAVAGRRFPIRYTMPGRANRVEITGTWGWAAVPKPVHRACLIQANRELKTRLSPEGNAGLDSFGGAIRVPAPPDPRATGKLDRGYVRNQVLVA